MPRANMIAPRLGPARWHPSGNVTCLSAVELRRRQVPRNAIVDERMRVEFAGGGDSALRTMLSVLVRQARPNRGLPVRY